MAMDHDSLSIRAQKGGWPVSSEGSLEARIVEMVGFVWLLSLQAVLACRHKPTRVYSH